LRDGRINMGAGLTVSPTLTEASFLIVAGDRASPCVGHGSHRSYVLPPVSLQNRTYTPSLFFTDGVVSMVSLTWADPEKPSGDPWANWSEERERAIAKDDARWLAASLEDVGSTADTYTFDWGTAWSGFNERDGFSSVGVRYDRG
jgi:hypothetical protein